MRRSQGSNLAKWNLSRRNRKKARGGSRSPAKPGSASPTRPEHSTTAQRRSSRSGGSTLEEQYFFSGPLPDPTTLAQYEQVIPGFGERILSEYESQGQHRRRLEDAVVTKNLAAQTRGQYIAGLGFVAIVAGAVFLGSLGHTAVALALIGIDILSFGGVYVWGRKKQSDERQSR